ncbi:MAG: 4Fe-4S binding protein [Bacteroidetes bacterium]|nr:4Fe-4S binding protein [Bacteroidota bacterium]MCW5895751.1 4Fe-4S binding protein [Bacteroidota bacterium]
MRIENLGTTLTVEEVAETVDIVKLARKADPKKKIKKLPRELRKEKINYSAEPSFVKRLVLRWKEDAQFQRSAVQLAFALLCIWIGVEFYLFMQWGMSGGTEQFFERPPGAEGFLPISALMSLKHWVLSGSLNPIHPSSVFILLAIIAVSLALRKSFCSWLCPIGTLSESLWMLGKKIFKRNFTVWRWLDYPLRSLKYLLLYFFVNAIWQMDLFSLENFIHSPYNKVADIKMYLFFADISTFALWTIIILMVFSIFIKNFWCRFLCPYGALLGIAGWLSPLKITRNKSTCIDCELCTKACPSNINVHRIGNLRKSSPTGRVWSDECISCMQCVQACPAKNTLDVRPGAKSKNAVPTWVYGTLVAGVFVAITGLAMLTGKWQNAISREEYQRRFQELDKPVYNHFRGDVPDYGPKD